MCPYWKATPALTAFHPRTGWRTGSSPPPPVNCRRFGLGATPAGGSFHPPLFEICSRYYHLARIQTINYNYPSRRTFHTASAVHVHEFSLSPEGDAETWRRSAAWLRVSFIYSSSAEEAGRTVILRMVFHAPVLLTMKKCTRCPRCVATWGRRG